MSFIILFTSLSRHLALNFVVDPHVPCSTHGRGGAKTRQLFIAAPHSFGGSLCDIVVDPHVPALMGMVVQRPNYTPKRLFNPHRWAVLCMLRVHCRVELNNGTHPPWATKNGQSHGAHRFLCGAWAPQSWWGPVHGLMAHGLQRTAT